MGRLRTIGILILMAFIGFQCEQDPVVECSCAPPNNNYALTIPYKKEITAYQCCEKQIRIRFETLMQDSRCPSNVDCVWEGTAIIGIVINGDEKTVYPLEIHKPITREIMGFSWKIELTDLEPNPVEGVNHVPGDYVATIAVEKQ